MKNQTYTALDIGSSSIKVIIARIANDGRFDIKGVAQLASSGIESGDVKDIQSLSACIRTAMKEAEEMAHLDAENIFVNISGSHIRTQSEEGRIPIPKSEANEPGEILEEQVEAVKNQARDVLKIRKGFERSKILHSIAQNFSIDGRDDIQNPLNMNGFQLCARVYNVLTDVTTIRNLAKACELAGYAVEPDNFVLNHVALDSVLLSDDERRLGCISIDIGGGTCDISLYYNSILHHVFVIPMGGENITRDLAIGLKTTIANAEDLKTQFGSANSAKVDPNIEIDVEGISSRPTSTRSQFLISQIIQHRVEDIFNECYKTIQGFYYPETITAGIVLTGGTAQLKDIDSIVGDIFNLYVKIGTPDLSRITGFITKLEDPAWSVALGLLSYGAKSGLETPGHRRLMPDLSKYRIFNKFKNILKEI